MEVERQCKRAIFTLPRVPRLFNLTLVLKFLSEMGATTTHDIVFIFIFLFWLTPSFQILTHMLFEFSSAAGRGQPHFLFWKDQYFPLSFENCWFSLPPAYRRGNFCQTGGGKLGLLPDTNSYFDALEIRKLHCMQIICQAYFFAISNATLWLSLVCSNNILDLSKYVYLGVQYSLLMRILSNNLQFGISYQSGVHWGTTSFTNVTFI